MNKNHHGFVVIGLLVFVVVGLIGSTGWMIYKTQEKSSTNEVIQQSNNTQNELNNDPIDRSVPTAPSNFKVRAAGNGYDLSWTASRSATSIVKYQIYYQDKLLTEPADTNIITIYLHLHPAVMQFYSRTL